MAAESMTTMDQQYGGSLKRLTGDALGSRSTELAVRPTGDRRASRMGTLWPENEQVLALDLKRLLDMFWARKWLLTGMFTTIVTVTLLVLLSFPPQYEAVSKVVIVPDEPIVEVRSMIAPLSTESQAIESEIEIIKSKLLVGPVIQEIGFRRHLAAPSPPSRLELWLGLPPAMFVAIREWLAAATATGEPTDDKVFRAFYDKLDVSRVPNTSVIAIGFQATDPVLAASAANQLVQSYVESQVEAKRAGRTEAIKLLAARLHELRGQVDASDQAVERFRTEQGLVKSASTELINQQLSEQILQLAIARVQQVTVEERLTQLEALRADGARELYDLLGAPAVQHLRGEVLQLQRDRARQSQEFGPKHPIMDRLDADLREANSRLSGEVNNALQAVHSEATMAAGRIRELELTIATLKKEMADVNAKEYTLRRLEAEAAINRSLHDAIVNRMREAEDAVFERADARIVDQAVVPTEPASTNNKIIFGLALIGAFCLSSAVAFGVEFLNGGFRTEEELAGSLGQPVLAAVPCVSTRTRRAASGAREAISLYGSAYIEAFHRLQTSLELVGAGPVTAKAPTLLVTSAIPGEGKSTIVSGLARLAAGMGVRVLVVDCDLRRPSVHAHFGIDNHEGLSTCKLDQSGGRSGLRQPLGNGLVRVDRSSGVHVIPAGPITPNPQRLLRSSLLPRILMAERSAHDLILIDSSPVLAVADPLVVGQLCDTVLLVVKWSSTPQRLVERAVARIAAGGLRVAGCVFNHVAQSAHRADKYKYVRYL
jgi:succinoglycan biosynthesis transport protein ExoP